MLQVCTVRFVLSTISAEWRFAGTSVSPTRESIHLVRVILVRLRSPLRYAAALVTSLAFVTLAWTNGKGVRRWRKEQRRLASISQDPLLQTQLAAPPARSQPAARPRARSPPHPRARRRTCSTSMWRRT